MGSPRAVLRAALGGARRWNARGAVRCLRPGTLRPSGCRPFNPNPGAFVSTMGSAGFSPCFYLRSRGCEAAGAAMKSTGGGARSVRVMATSAAVVLAAGMWTSGPSLVRDERHQPRSWTLSRARRPTATAPDAARADTNFLGSAPEARWKAAACAIAPRLGRCSAKRCSASSTAPVSPFVQVRHRRVPHRVPRTRRRAVRRAATTVTTLSCDTLTCVCLVQVCWSVASL